MIADLYRKRWTIETAFAELEATLNGEVNTLGYPKAALFAFCVALVSYNVLSTVKAALRSVHGDEVVTQDVSGYYVAEEVTIRGRVKGAAAFERPDGALDDAADVSGDSCGGDGGRALLPATASQGDAVSQPNECDFGD